MTDDIPKIRPGPPVIGDIVVAELGPGDQVPTGWTLLADGYCWTVWTGREPWPLPWPSTRWPRTEGTST